MGEAPTVVVVGAASRDLVDDDPRGWRLGGGVSYAALTLARLGLRVGALVVADDPGAASAELATIRDEGVEVVRQPGSAGPVFVNVETPSGRVQRSPAVSDAVDPAELPAHWRGARAWLLAPVAAELPEAWAEVPPPGSLVALGWQGLLRVLVAGDRVRHRAPGESSVVRRADIVGVGRDDFDAATTSVDDLLALVHPGATLLVTDGARGGEAIEAAGGGGGGGRGRRGRARRWESLPADGLVDPVGAGDAFLAGVLAAHVDPSLTASWAGPDPDLRLGAACASLTVEAPGMAGVPRREAVFERMRGGEQRTR